MEFWRGDYELRKGLSLFFMPIDKELKLTRREANKLFGWASSNENLKFIKILLEGGAGVGNEWSVESALIEASGYNENPEIIKTLLKAGATVNKMQKRSILGKILNGKSYVALSKEKQQIYDLIKNQKATH
ncbi:MAG: hypothetical protein Rsou_1808 [Candidatus Ruthia sp. Asou_11_S2]|nr:hypothetical protein [Candidatus Ruthia sp. Asou_11_S2]